MRDNKSKTGVGQNLRQLRMEKKKRKKKRLITFAILEVLTLILIFSYAYVLRITSKIQRPDYVEANVKNNDISVENKKKMEGYLTFAVFGVDSRNSAVGKGNNSDVIMIVSMNRSTGDIKIASVYRDTYLDTGNGRLAKINNAYAVGGPEQAVKALNKNLDLDIKDYVTFSWKAVATTVNLMGGVDIDITPAELREINGYITETVKGTGIGSVQIKKSGMQHLDGIQAVAYARLRHMDSDFERTARQRRVLEQIFVKAKKADFRLLQGVAEEVLPMVATNFTLQDGLDMLGTIGRYNIAETTGFPEKKGDSDMGSRGWNVIPKTLESNVIDLHTFFFGNEAYSVSNTVKSIDAKIAASGGGPLKTTKSKNGKEGVSEGAIQRESQGSLESNENGDSRSTYSNRESTKVGESTKAGETSKQKESTKVGETTKVGESTKAGETSKANENTVNVESRPAETVREGANAAPHSSTKEATKASVEGPTSKETVRNAEPIQKETTKGVEEVAPNTNTGGSGIDGAIAVPNKPE